MKPRGHSVPCKLFPVCEGLCRASVDLLRAQEIGVALLKPNKLVQIEEHVEQIPGHLAPLYLAKRDRFFVNWLQEGRQGRGGEEAGEQGQLFLVVSNGSEESSKR